MYESNSDIAQQVQREVNSRDWLAKNKSRVLRACKINDPEDESPEALAAAQSFVKMMENLIERNDWGWSMGSLENAFQTLIKRGLLSNSEPPPPPAPRPQLYYVELHPIGGETKTKGPFSAQDAVAKAQFYAREQTAVTIRDAVTGDAVDMDLQPLVDNPLGQRTAQQPQQPQQSQSQAKLEREYLSFYQSARSDQIKRRMRAEKGFSDWVVRSGQLDFVQASSGGVDEHGRAVEPRRL